MSAHTVAVDWSGDARQAHKRIWLAECEAPGRLQRLEAGRDRTALAEHLLSLCESWLAPSAEQTVSSDLSAGGRPPESSVATSDLQLKSPDVSQHVATGSSTPRGGPPQPLVIGLDFAFSFPAWFFESLGLTSAPDLWAHVAEHGEGWLSACDPPFWGRSGRRRPALDRLPWRRCELATPPIGGIRPKSVFQIGGAGAVGTGSIRGMPILSRLVDQGATIWPFVSGGSPIVFEIYPRLLTGAVRKSDAVHRAAHLARFYPKLDAEHVRLATACEDAFDAAVSALVMHDCWADLCMLPAETDPELKLEGRIWHPGWRSDRP